MPMIGHLFRKPMRRVAGVLKRLASERSGNSLIEFAVALPLMLTLSMYGIEMAYMHTVNMQVSQIAMALADNASRLDQTDNSAVAPTLNNGDIDSVMSGAMTQGGPINFQANGRLVLSSLERDKTTARQFISWQKCRGTLAKGSAYGPAGYGKTGTVIIGLGKTGREIKAQDGVAVMFVEAFYQYKPLFGTMFVKNTIFSQEAAFQVRDDRNLAAGVSALPVGSSEC